MMNVIASCFFFVCLLCFPFTLGRQKGVSINPRTKNPAHQVEDLSVADASFTALSAAQMAAIDAIHPNPRDAPVYKVCPDPKPLK